LIKQRHIRVGKQLIDAPSFMVKVENEKHIDFALTSPHHPSGKPGRVAAKSAKNGGGGGDE
jgi:small subunit ribosomal protein S9e